MSALKESFECVFKIFLNAKSNNITSMEPMDREGELRWKIRRFLRTRRNDETKNYVWSIIEILERAREEDSGKIGKREAGWVRVKVLLDELVGPDKKIKNETTFYRLANDLFEEKIIERRAVPMPDERMRSATFYRTSEPYQLWWFLSRDQIEEEYSKSQVYITELFRHLVIARDLLEEMGCPDSLQKIADDYKLLYDREPISNFDKTVRRKEEEHLRSTLFLVGSKLVPVRRKTKSTESSSKNKSE